MRRIKPVWLRAAHERPFSRTESWADKCCARTQTLDAKKEWNEHFEAYIRALDKKKPVIWTGDLNVAPTALGEYSRCFASPHVDPYSTRVYATPYVR